MNRRARALSGLLLIIHICSGNVKFDDPCHYNFTVINQRYNISSKPEKAQNLSDILRLTIDYKVDPCDNFYNFACGTWIKNILDEPEPWNRITTLGKMKAYYLNELKEAVVSLKESKSKAITQALSFYDECMTAEDAWKQSGISMVQQIWNKIKEYGDFPMLSEKKLDDLNIGSKFNITWLLAYFNQNRTILHSIVPRVAYDESSSKAYISFYPKTDIFAFLQEGLTARLQQSFQIFIFKLLKTIAADVGVHYRSTTAPKDVVDMMRFMKQLYSISVPHVNKLDDEFFMIRKSKKERLKEVDQKSLHVNWTEYLLLVAPTEVHSYILGDPQLLADSAYMEKVDEVLRETTPRTLTNFVIVHYIISWVTVLEAKYRKLVYEFAKRIGSSELVDRRSELCYDLVKEDYYHAVLAIYAHSKNYGNDTKPILEEMIRGITASFKDQLNENEWIEDDFRKAVSLKLDNLEYTLLYDEISKNFTALDELYSEHLKIGTLPFIRMLDEIARTEKMELFRKLLQKFDVGKTWTTIAVHYGDSVGASYFNYQNKIVFPLNFAQYPLFNSAFPRAYVYGSVGSVIAHEISHCCDKLGMEFDYTGNRTEWYKSEWIEGFEKELQCYVQQYDNTTIPIFDMPLNGTRTLNENVADNEGIKISYKAYKLHHDTSGVEARVPFFEDFTLDQLFFIGFAKPLCAKASDLSLYYGLTKIHSQEIYRINNVLMNTPEFADAFHCPLGSSMNPKEKCSVW